MVGESEWIILQVCCHSQGKDVQKVVSRHTQQLVRRHRHRVKRGAEFAVEVCPTLAASPLSRWDGTWAGAIKMEKMKEKIMPRAAM